MTSEVLSQQAKSDHAPFTVVPSFQIKQRRTAVATYLLALFLGLGLAAFSLGLGLDSVSLGLGLECTVLILISQDFQAF